eukprot:264579_1
MSTTPVAPFGAQRRKSRTGWESGGLPCSLLFVAGVSALVRTRLIKVGQVKCQCGRDQCIAFHDTEFEGSDGRVPEESTPDSSIIEQPMLDDMITHLMEKLTTYGSTIATQGPTPSGNFTFSMMGRDMQQLGQVQRAPSPRPANGA